MAGPGSRPTAPGFGIVQSHLPDWKVHAPQTMADGGLHALLHFVRELRARDRAPGRSSAGTDPAPGGDSVVQPS